MTNSDPHVEYKDASNNMRHYSNVQFAQLTVFIAVIGGLTALMFGSKLSAPCGTMVLLKIAGLIVSIVFYLMSESAIHMWAHFLKRAVDIEKSLGYEQYSSLPGAPRFKKVMYRPGTWALRIFYLCMIAFWAVELFGWLP